MINGEIDAGRLQGDLAKVLRKESGKHVRTTTFPLWQPVFLGTFGMRGFRTSSKRMVHGPGDGGNVDNASVNIAGAAQRDEAPGQTWRGERRPNKEDRVLKDKLKNLDQANKLLFVKGPQRVSRVGETGEKSTARDNKSHRGGTLESARAKSEGTCTR